MSRWTATRQVNELIQIHRGIAEAKEAVHAEWLQDIRAARENVRLTLGSHGLFMASSAMRIDNGMLAYVEFQKMANRMRAGGYHKVRAAMGRVPE